MQKKLHWLKLRNLRNYHNQSETAISCMAEIIWCILVEKIELIAKLRTIIDIGATKTKQIISSKSQMSPVCLIVLMAYIDYRPSIYFYCIKYRVRLFITQSQRPDRQRPVTLVDTWNSKFWSLKSAKRFDFAVCN
jgi:hypothetical protein